MDKKKLQIEQLESRIKLFSPTLQLPNPPTGWVKAIRSALGMTMQQLANKLGITKQSVQEIELREKEGSITLKSLKETARALDMELVYGFVPKEGTLDKYLESKARFLAEQIVYRTSISMKLEDQQNSNERIKKAIDERTILIKQELPKQNPSFSGECEKEPVSPSRDVKYSFDNTDCAGSPPGKNFLSNLMLRMQNM